MAQLPLQFATLELGVRKKRGLAAALFVFSGPNVLENSQHSVATSPFAAAANFPVKRRGEIAELAFLLKATSLGFGVAKPWGDSDRFDFIITSRQLDDQLTRARRDHRQLAHRRGRLRLHVALA